MENLTHIQKEHATQINRYREENHAISLLRTYLWLLDMAGHVATGLHQSNESQVILENVKTRNAT